MEASSILSSEMEGVEADVADSGSNNGKAVNGVVVGDLDTGLQSTNVIMDVDDEDAICRRTSYSLASFTLDELETFLQETDDKEDLPNVDYEAEGRKFLAAVLHGGDADQVAEKVNENIEDEDDDADFVLEIEEALESDVYEILKSPAQVQSFDRGCRRPETRQNKRKKSSAQLKKKSSAHLNMPLRPLLPNVPVLPSTAFQRNLMMLQSAPRRQPSSAYESMLNGFTPHQIGQLYCLIHEHVQLLIQMYSLCIFDPSKGNIATQIQQLILEILKKRNQVLTWRTTPYPSSYFFPPYIRPSVSNERDVSLPTQNTSPSSMNASEIDSCPENNMTLPSDGGRHKSVSCRKEGQLQGTEGPMWMPYINGHVLSILDVAPLNLAKSYMDEVSSAVQEYQRRHVGDACDTPFEKEPLFPLKTLHVSASSGKGNDQGPKMTRAGTLSERSKKQPVAPVPKQIAKLAQRFVFLFNPALFPHEPLPAGVVNRVLFTDAEDMLLASGLMEFNKNWELIQQCFLPCKSPNQIFVRQKNCACFTARENPIKAVWRLKNSPLTEEEIARIREGLVIFKNDWMSVWKSVVPYRDPTLLRRQWRVATGTQKSYKSDEQKKKKRRLYESNRRKGKPGNPIKWHSSSEKEDCSADKENGAYVHEAFLADWKPDTSGDQDGSDLHMHPLLFRTPEDRRLPYYPLNSFNSFPRSQPLLNISLFHNPKQANYTVSQSRKPSNSMEKGSFGIDFHPLLQRSSEVNSSSISARPVAEQSHPAELSGIKHARSQKSVDAAVSNVVPVSTQDIPFNPIRKMNELVTREAPSAHVSGIKDIQDTSSLLKHPTGSSAEAIPPVIGQNVDSVTHALLQTNQYGSTEVEHNTPNQLLSEIVMEQEELSDSEVEFECEEMTDTEGEETSDLTY